MVTQKQPQQPDINQTPALIPHLESGDRLSRYEFERRYQAMPKHKKAELIEGVVYLASPLRFQSHAEPHGKIVIWLGTYQISTPGIKLGIEPTVRLDQDNEPQPDAVLLIEPSLGGKSRLTTDDYIEGAPELVIEIAASSAAYDLHDKKKAYRRNGIQEYIVWQMLENRLDWFALNESEYVPLEPNAEGILQSQVMPGLWLAVSALMAGDMSQVMAVLQAGLNSPEHIEFITRLASNIV
ncbi:MULTISPECIES: Uma2 family endonuclease [Calothrix]|uniref:Uma2 family endonuclease n=2 Tax=Calothrix TaxID=1186 RepID=A0ABR8A665_9CYAN|nr:MULTISPECIES: Uma2 family endonuclease [Calothrix]MBD2195298.1 Uma2 family endonuclease [Calothrix parietina FACHB-288]MBD2223897.1 Uma2 family endonuclease [Calothrix anomala FACHB-343]